MQARTKSRLPDGPKGHWALGNRRVFSDDPLAFLRSCAHHYGAITRIAEQTYLVADTTLIGEVLGDDGARFGKLDPDPTQRRTAFPASVMSSTGDDWRHKRQLMQPAFRSAQVRDHAIQAMAATQPMLRHWANQAEAVDMRLRMTELCAQLGAGFLLGTPSQADQLLRLMPMVDAIMQQTRSQVRLPSWCPTPGKRRLQRARGDLDAALNQIIDHRLASPTPTASLLDRLLTEDPQGRSAWCRDEMAAMLISALEPMAAGLTWTMLLLAQHPPIAQAVAHEADAVLGNAALGTHATIDTDRIERLRHTRAVVKEALRLYPPAWMTGRVAQSATTLGGFDVPAGTQLIVSQWVTHRDPHNYGDPDTFAPQRWLDETHAPSLKRYSYFPFGGGPRSCIGSMLAITQMTMVTACVMRAFSLQLAADARPTPFPALVLRPLDVRIALLPRQAPLADPATSPSAIVPDNPHD